MALPDNLPPTIAAVLIAHWRLPFRANLMFHKGKGGD